MKTQIIYFRLILLPILGLLFLGLHSCVAPTDISGPNDKKIIDSPYVLAPLFKPNEVELILDQETNLAPNDDLIKPIWANKIEHSILIDTNKIDGRILPRILLRFDAVGLPNGSRPREITGPLLRRISISLPDTVDLNNDDFEELEFKKDDLPEVSNFFVYSYKGSEIKVILKEDALIKFRIAKIEKRNRIIVHFNFTIFLQLNGINQGQRHFGKGQFVINY